MTILDAQWIVDAPGMASLIREYDWASTSIGPLEFWPASLRTATNLMLALPEPISILWGVNHVQLHNDAYVGIAGDRYAKLLGKCAVKAWLEASGHNPADIFRQVFLGTAVVVDEENDPSEPGRGPVANSACTGIFLPIRDESGKIAGIYHRLNEPNHATSQVVQMRARASRHIFRAETIEALRSLSTPAEIMALVASRLGPFLQVDRAGYYKVDGDHFVITEEWRTPSSIDMRGRHPMANFGEELAARLRANESVRFDDTRRVPEADAFAAIGSLAVLTVPVHYGGVWAGGLHLHQARVRPWSDDEVALVREIAVQAWAAVERSRSEKRLRSNEERYRALFNTIDDALCVIELVDGPKGRLSDYVHVQANPAYEANSGLPDIVGRRARDVIGDEADTWVETFRNVLLSGKPVRFERLLGATGRHLEVAAFRVQSGEKYQVAVIFKDVSGRKLAEDALKSLNATLEQQVSQRTSERDRMWDTSPDLMLVIDFHGFIRRTNPAWTAVLGYVSDELVGRHINEFVVASDHADTIDAYESAAKGDKPRIENRYRHKDGSLRWISWTAAPAGEVTYATGRDVTAERKRQTELEAAQEQLRQSQKMEALGQLTGGVAHDFNNLLTPIIGLLDKLVRQGTGSERDQRLIDIALQAAERGKVLVERLLAFSRRQPLQPVAVDVVSLVKGVASLLGATLGPMIDLRVDLADDLPPATADPNQLEMALLNLAVNARDAMQDGGSLAIVASRESIRTQHRSDVRPGHYVRISVVDTGSGMDEATVRRAIEPFFSTKGVGKGTGLGLSMVHGLVKQLNGGLTIDSVPGSGTTIQIWLPISPKVIDRESGYRDSNLVRSTCGTVLLIDDEELVRVSIADMLAEIGYNVVEAVSAESALEMINGGLLPNVIVTDHLMPGMSGVQLARELKISQPELPILIASGFAEAEGVAPDIARLTKPFTAAKLAATLAALLATRQRGG